MARPKQQDVTENPLYHDTWKLLQKYRDVVWSIARQDMQQNRGIPPVSPPPIPEILDGDRMPLPD